MAIAQNFPITSPSLSLDFAQVKKLDPRVTFARASSATYYDGVTTAKAEENLLLQSQALATSPWTSVRSTRTNNDDTAPDGTTTATSVIQASGQTTYGGVTQNATVTAGDYVLSIFAKPNGKNFLVILEQLLDGTSKVTWFDVQNGTVGTTSAGHTATITASTNSYYRCSIKFTANAARTAAVIFYAADTDGSTTVTDSGGLFLWGAQLEQRDAVTAYTPTTTQPITNYIPVLQSAANNVARFDHNPVTGESLGLLIEEQRTNRVLYSEQFDDASWVKTGGRVAITSNQIIAPDGTLTADLLQSTGGASGSRIIVQADATSTTGKSLSVYAKAGSATFLQLLFAVDTAPWANFDLSNGTVGSTGTVTSATIMPVGNGWYRCQVSTASTTITNALIGIVSSSTAGRNESNTLETGLYIWGAQLEAGAFPTSYIKTEASQVTRSADAASMTGANFSSWYRQDEGTVYFEGQYPLSSSGFVAITDGTASNRIVIGRDGAPTNTFLVGANGVTQAQLISAVNVPFGGSFFKCSGAYKVDDFAYQRDGQSTLTDTSGTTPVVNQLRIGGLPYLSNFELNGCVRKLSYYPLRLSNAELVALTS